MKYLSIFILLAVLPILGCDRFSDPEHQRQEINKTIKQIAAFNAQADVSRAI